MPTGVYYDEPGGAAPTTAQRAGPYRISRPIAQDSTCVMVYARYCIAAASFSPLAIMTAGPTIAGHATYLVDETPLEDAGGDLAFWDRVYVSLPASRVEYELINYPYQQEYNNGAGVNYVASLTLTRLAKVYVDYFNTATPSSITLNRVMKTVLVNNVYTHFDGFFNAGVGATIVGQDGTISRWHGNIWERRLYDIVV